MQTFGADAGTIHLLDDDSSILKLRAGAGVSDAFIETVRELPRDRVIDQEVLGGEVICIEDLGADGTALHLDAIAREGLTGLISAGLLFRGQTFGIMRLFTHRRLTLTQRERALARAVAEQISGAIAGARLVESERKRRAYQRAVGLAADIQRRMLPNAPPKAPGLDIAARYEPSLELGGDFYDLIELGGNLGVVVGDVVGKGIPAALLMAAVRASLRAHATDVYHLDEVVKRVNQALARDTHPNEFATLFYGVIDPHTLRLTYCNAGHDPPIVVRLSGAAGRADIDVFPLTAGGMVVGVDEHAHYERAAFQLRPGDLLVAYTDGVTDTMNFQNEKLGAARLRASIADLLATTPDASAEHAVNHLLWEVNRFAGLRPKIDDVTIVCVRVAHAASAPRTR
jgi:sigma-B regulation protein RsbU (phosphoserine phosphatase)